MGVDQDHAAAILSLLDMAPPQGGTALTVYDGRVPAGAVGPYVLVRMATTTPDVTDLTQDQNQAVTRIFCHCVAGQALGGDASALRAVRSRVDAALLNVTPTIPGRVPWPIRDEGDAPPPDVDDTTGITVWTQRLTYRLASVPVPA